MNQLSLGTSSTTGSIPFSLVSSSVFVMSVAYRVRTVPPERVTTAEPVGVS